jgi:hypothetical protein
MPCKAKSILIAGLILAVTCFAEPVRAGINVSVDWDGTLANGIQSTIVANPGDTVTATIVFTITGTSSISTYEVSTRFSSDELLFVSRTDTGPSNLQNTPPSSGNTGPIYNIQNVGSGDPNFGAFGVNEFIAGTVPNPGDPGPTSSSPPFAVSAITFTVRPGASGLVILPGFFNTSLDSFYDNSNTLVPESEVTFNGGSITAVPEPTAVAMVSVTLIAFGLHRSRKRRSNRV